MDAPAYKPARNSGMALRALFAVLALVPACGLAAAAAEPGSSRATSAQPLHQRIDELVEAAAVGPLAPATSDADFVRRVYLDFTGVIPTAEQARAFAARPEVASAGAGRP